MIEDNLLNLLIKYTQDRSLKNKNISKVHKNKNNKYNNRTKAKEKIMKSYNKLKSKVSKV